MTEKPLTIKDIDSLRAQGLLQEGETAVQIGDAVIAVHLVTQDRRVLNTKGIMLESSRRLLRD